MKKEKYSLNEEMKEELLKELEGSIIFQFHQLHNAIFRVANKMIEASSVPLKMEQIPVIMTLYFFKTKSQQSLADQVNRDKSSIFRTAAALEKKGLLKFKKDPNDARKKILELTDTGKFVAKQIGELISKIEKEIGEALSNRPKEEFLKELQNAAKKIDYMDIS